MFVGICHAQLRRRRSWPPSVEVEGELTTLSCGGGGSWSPSVVVEGELDTLGYIGSGFFHIPFYWWWGIWPTCFDGFGQP